jgi:hypothetical protein
MMPVTPPDPNTRPFPRALFLDSLHISTKGGRVHRLERAVLFPRLRKIDKANARHTMGAIDAIMDNLGMLFAEQFPPDEYALYLDKVKSIRSLYQGATQMVLDDAPWTGEYLLKGARSAKSGEPRPFLRLLGCTELSRKALAEVISGPGFADYDSVCPGVWRTDPYSNLVWDDLWPSDYVEPEAAEHRSMPSLPTGLNPPAGFPDVVPELRLLSPEQATPDLPLRVGMTEEDLDIYDDSAIDQGPHGTCVAVASAMALNVACHRVGKLEDVEGGFSAAWIHCDSAMPDQEWSDGRNLPAARDSLRRGLPCSAQAFPYRPVASGEQWKTTAREGDAMRIASSVGRPFIVDVDCHDIARMKTLLAAGWVIVTGAAFQAKWRTSTNFQDYGTPLSPLPGDTRDGGHAWLLVGYDHVDGNNQWKYQGRFYCLNSWGPSFPRKQTHGPAIFTLPFSFFLTEGYRQGGFAMRFPM